MSEGRSDADLHAEAGTRMMELYRRRMDGRSKTSEEAEVARRTEAIERRLRLAGLRAERDEIYRAARSRKVSDEIARRLVREIDLAETRLGAVS